MLALAYLLQLSFLIGLKTPKALAPKAKSASAATKPTA